MNFGFSMGKRSEPGRKDWKRYYDESVVADGPEFDALAKAGENCGLDRERALFYASKMLAGAATMAERSPLPPKTLCENVCSPGGSTIEGVKVLEAEGFDATVQKAIVAAFNRTKELGKK